MNITIRYRLRKVVTHDYGEGLVRRVGHFTRDDKKTPKRPDKLIPGPVTIEMPVSDKAKINGLFEMVWGSAE